MPCPSGSLPARLGGALMLRGVRPAEERRKGTRLGLAAEAATGEEGSPASTSSEVWGRLRLASRASLPLANSCGTSSRSSASNFFASSAFMLANFSLTDATKPVFCASMSALISARCCCCCWGGVGSQI